MKAENLSIKENKAKAYHINEIKKQKQKGSD